MKSIFNRIDILDKQIAERCFTLNKDYPNLKRFLAVFEFVFNGIPWFILTCSIYFLVEDDYWRESAKLIFIGNISNKSKSIQVNPNK